MQLAGASLQQIPRVVPQLCPPYNAVIKKYYLLAPGKLFVRNDSFCHKLALHLPLRRETPRPGGSVLGEGAHIG